MMQHALGLFLALAFIAFLLAGIITHTTWSTGLKIGIVAAAAGTLIACYFSLIALLGWPTPFGTPGQDLALIHAVVEEPGKSGDPEGGIYLWVRANETGAVPRALRFPYRRQLHEQVAEALRKASGGVRQGVRMSGPTGGSGANESFSVFDLHRPALTDKDYPGLDTNRIK